MATCTGCRAENPARAKFRLECGAPLVARCTGCGTELPPDAKFCLECGAKVGAPPAQGPVAADRRTSPLAEKIGSRGATRPKHAGTGSGCASAPTGSVMPPSRRSSASSWSTEGVGVRDRIAAKTLLVELGSADPSRRQSQT